MRPAGGFTQSVGGDFSSVLHGQTRDYAVRAHGCHANAPNGSDSVWISPVCSFHGTRVAVEVFGVLLLSRATLPRGDCERPRLVRRSLSNIDGNALIQTGPLFGDVPDLLRSVSDASVVPDRSTPDSTAYRVTVPTEETLSGDRVEGNEATLWLDNAGRLARAEFAFSMPVAGSSDPAVGHVRWVLSDWGDAEVEVSAPPDKEVESFPNCSI
jgi:hypothetical protein